jgi:hypothetical protein
MSINKKTLSMKKVINLCVLLGALMLITSCISSNKAAPSFPWGTEMKKVYETVSKDKSLKYLSKIENGRPAQMPWAVSTPIYFSLFEKDSQVVDNIVNGTYNYGGFVVAGPVSYEGLDFDNVMYWAAFQSGDFDNSPLNTIVYSKVLDSERKYNNMFESISELALTNHTLRESNENYRRWENNISKIEIFTYYREEGLIFKDREYTIILKFSETL